MAGSGGDPVDLGLDKVEMKTPTENLAALGVGGGFEDIEEEFSGKVGYLGCLAQEKGETVAAESGSKVSGDGVCEKVTVEGISREEDENGEKTADLECLIDQKLGKVSLDGTVNFLKSSENGEKGLSIMDVNGESAIDGDLGSGRGDVKCVNKNETKNNENVSGEEETDSKEESGSDEESESESSSSASSSDDEDEDENDEEETKRGAVSGLVSVEKKFKNMEEGEIDTEEGDIMLSDGDEMVAWSDNEYGGGNGMTGPVKSKNELKVLPPVPPVIVTLESHHQTLPIGTILSIMGAQVIVEGVEKHNPLSEGSILWITQTRSPLGIVDEIFGPVKNPYYIVRHNSENEVPSEIEQGTLISFVPEFANHILNDKSLYQKGYDASNENDEELSDELEFSDDEKEAEYKKMLKMKKRGTNESKLGTKRNEKKHFKNQTGNRNENNASTSKSPSLNLENYSNLSSLGQGSAINHSLMAPGPGFGIPNEIWGNGFQPQIQNIGFPNGMPAMPWMQQIHPQQFFQAALQAQQQIGTMPGFPSNFNSLGGIAPWPGFVDQNLLNQLQFAMGLQSQQAPQPLNAGGEQAFQSNESQVSHNLEQSPVNSGRLVNFNRGRGGGRRGANYRGRGRGGGRARN